MSKLFIAGSGRIGRATGLLAHKILGHDVCFGDIDKNIANQAVKFAKSKKRKSIVQAVDMNDWRKVKNILKESDVLLDCLPGYLTPRMATLAINYNTHYANLSEHVKATEYIVTIANNQKKGFILQTGVAPGFVNVQAMKLFNEFCSKYKVNKVDYIKMRVGALTNNVSKPGFYAFTWSPNGVATEYIEKAPAIRNGKKVNLIPLMEREKVVIDRILYEEDITSGGASDLPDVMHDKTNNLDYKTFRFPGHFDYVKDLRDKIGYDKDKLLEAMLKDIPTVEENDFMVIYTAVEGNDNQGLFRRLDKSYLIEPKDIAGRKLSAIQATTAAPLVQCAQMLITKRYSGVIQQSQIDYEMFLSGEIIQRVYD